VRIKPQRATKPITIISKVQAKTTTKIWVWHFKFVWMCTVHLKPWFRRDPWLQHGTKAWN